MAENQGHLFREQIGARGAGQKLLPWLCARGPHTQAAEWQARIAQGLVRLDGERADPAQTLEAGQWLSWQRPPWLEPAAPLSTAVLYQDPHLLAVAKPRGLPTMPGGGDYQDNTLLALVRRRAPEAVPMHRLGRATSGVVLFSRNLQAARAVQAAFRQRRLRKLYRALCEGEPAKDRFEVEAPIGEVPHARLGTVHAAAPEGRASRSLVRVLERRGATSLVEVEIETGRPHQIRIHLAFAGHPLAGDPLYGEGGLPRAGSVALPGDPGYLLHALRLSLLHPITAAPLVIECAPPPALRSAPE